MLDLLLGIEERLSGRLEPEIAGSLSYNRFPVGALASHLPADQQRSHRDALRRPTTIGTRFLIPKHDLPTATLDVELSFSVFHPVFPRWEQIAHLTRPPSENQKETRIKEAERRIDGTFSKTSVRIKDIYDNPSRSLDWNIDALNEAMREAASHERSMLMDPDDSIRYFKRGRRFLKASFFETPEGQRAQAFEKWVSEQTGDVVVPNWAGSVQVVVEEQGDCVEIAVVISNDSVQDAQANDWKAFMHDCRFNVRVNGATIQHQPLGRNLVKDYRVKPTVQASGIHCCVETIDDCQVQNLPIPSHVLRHVEPNSDFTDSCRFDVLASEGYLAALHCVVAGMKDYRQSWEARREELIGASPSKADATSWTAALEEYDAEVARFEQGIWALQNDARAERAFCLLNEAMDRANGTAHGADGFDAWRTFQLVFIVSSLKDVVAREHPEWGHIDDRDHVDVVWVATGGGKTESYLGLIAFALFFDRMRGKERGLTSWVKFPLRMLSLDQLDRFCKLFLILNQIANEQSLGGDSFLIGYYMGDANTPNAFSVHSDFQRYGKSPKEIGEALDDLRTGRMAGKSRADISNHLFNEVLQEKDKKRYRLMTACPARDCKEPVHVWVDGEAQETSIICPIHGALPVIFVDDEIYRRVPSVVISTIDKLAILAFNPEVRNLIIRPYGHCNKHGYYSSDSKAKGSCKGCGFNKAPVDARRVDASEFYDPAPALQVQDELHLLKEQLGSYDSHYESLVDHIHTRLLPNEPRYRVHGAKGRTKIVGATATISEYEHQVAQLYGRQANARRFPVWGATVAGNFYMRATQEARRVLASLWAVNMSGPVAHDEILFSYWGRLAGLINNADNQRQMLAAAHIDPASVSSDDWGKALSLAATTLSYFQNKQKAYQRIQDLEGGFPKFCAEYAREHEGLLGEVAQRLASLTGDNNFEEIRATKTRLESPFGGDGWLAHLAATSIISHGVDVGRLNFILFSGQPSETAEYIQASSRVGRKHLGVSLVAGDTLHDRDELHYINHRSYHENQNSFVSGASISRYSRNLITRTFPGLLLALIQMYWNPTRPSQPYQFKPSNAEAVAEALDNSSVRNALKPILVEFLQTGTPDPDMVQDLVSNTWADMLQEGQRNQIKGKRFRDRFPHYQPLTNHREIEEAFQIQTFGDDAHFLDSSDRIHTVRGAPDEPDASPVPYKEEMGAGA